MKEYKIKSEDTKHFSLTLNDQEIGRLKYEKWFSFKAEMILGGTMTYQIEPKGFWGTTIELKQNEKILLNFKMIWNGDFIINTRFDEIERDFILKHKGIFKESYVILNKQDEELLVIRPDFKWNKLNYDYNISTTDQFDNLSFNVILLLTTIHCINYCTTMMSTGM
ncbi:hypothetical protein [Emticicia sp.]|uniref:hypothetical protein n=1 Tax=Emticicia sp. TaxID=1930953 RepID=UPI00375193DB